MLCIRRSFVWTACLVAAGCAQTQPEPAARADDASLAGCIATLRAELPRHPEVSAETFDRYTRDVQDLRPVIEQASQVQPEFVLPVWDYIARRADAERAADGAALIAREADALKAIEQRHGVDAASVVAVFGIETDYGRVPDRYPVVDATLSRACLRLSSAERKRHFFAALQLLQQGLVRPEEFKGSWAGAFGMTQFMPGTFVAYMDDGDGQDGPDILHSVPDALATTARYLAALGWRSGQRWGLEVRVPAQLAAQWNAQEDAHQCLAAARPAGKCRPLQQWAAEGVSAVDGTPLAEAAMRRGLASDTPTALLMPAGAQGPAWLVTGNYQALWRYNRADAYALAIGLLSDALRGEPPQQAPWPTDDPGLSRAELRELQQRLHAAGHCEVVADGLEGPRTQAAIRVEESRRGLPETGHAGQRLLRLLREGAPAADAPACQAGG
jgi:glucose-6-phosphate 1-epimerase